MPGVRIDRLFASTAVVLLLCAAAGASFAEPKAGSKVGSAESVAPVPAAPASAPQSDQSSAKPPGSAGDTASPPATKPQTSLEQPAEAAAETETVAKPDTGAKPDTAAEQPALVAAKPIEPASGPFAPVAAPVAATPAVAPRAPVPATQASISTTDRAVDEPVAPAGDEVPAAKPPSDGAIEKDTMPPAPAPVAAPPAAAPSETAAAPASAAVADADAAIAEQLRGLVDGKFDRVIGSKKERAAIDAFYAARNYAPLWIADGKANARAKAAIAYLGQVDADGLEPADYPVPNFSVLADPAALAEAEIRLTTSVATYAHHALAGRVHWTRVSGDIYYDRKIPTAGEVLAEIADAKDAGETLAGYEPQSPGYRALKAKLAELRAGKSAGQAPIGSGPLLKVGMQDERVPQLRQRLGLSGSDDTTFDKTLADAVKKFQQEHELKVSGTLTAATVEALNGRLPDRPIDTITANMERWRWMPHDLGKSYVIVNLPDFTLRVFHDGQQVWMTKIVDGKPTMPTPIMSAEMKYITINPTWNVPPSIVAKEYMPALQQDPTVLERMGLRVSSNPDGTVHISQPPGERNALGRVRFNFPNKFLVYQHDTPDKHLFALDKRAFSHGCMRVQDPVKYAEVLLSIVRPGEGYTQERIRKMFGDSEADIPFPKYLPVHLTYQTAFVDEEGNLEFREDIYGRDKALLAILKSDERKVADIPIERRDNTIRREVLAIPDQQTLWSGGRSYYGGGNFFTRLFGGSFATQPAPPPAPAPRKHAAQRRTEIN